MIVTQKEIVEALTGSWLVPDGVDADAWIAIHQTELAMRIESEGIAPPDGYAIVPIEPTAAMIDATGYCKWTNGSGLILPWVVAPEVYKAMLTAAKESL